MQVRHAGAIALTLVFLLSASAVSALAGSRHGDADALAKRLAAKSADRDGYTPMLAKGAAELLAETEPNDTAAQAQAVAVGDIVDAAVAEGDVDWFAVSAAAASYLTVSTASLDGSDTDTVLEAFAADGITRLSIDDDGGLGLFSAMQHLSVPGDGLVLVRVTRFGPLGDDAYRLSVEPGVAPPAVPENDTPATAIVLEACNTSLTAITTGASSAVSGLGCVEFDPLGGDVYYAVELPFSFQLTVSVTPNSSWDPSLYLFTDPSDPAGSCLMGTDEAFAAESETLIYTNDDEVAEATMMIYVGVDSWELAQQGEFTLELNCDFVVSNEADSWGGLKSRFER